MKLEVTILLMLVAMCVGVFATETVDTVVVGAGIGGLTSGRKLTDAGRSNVVILEAKNRYGGRIHTVNVDGYPYPIELGASFFHDGNYNPMIALAQQAGIALAPMDFGSSKAWKDGRPLNANQGARIYNNYLDVWAKAEPFFQRGRSIAEALQLGGYDFDDRGVETLLMTDEQVYGDNLELIDSALTDEPPGDLGTNYIVPGGYKQILDYLLDYPTSIRDKLRLNSRVTVIDYAHPNDKVTVTYIQNGVQKQIVANQVIVAVPMGILQAGTIQFIPALPADKQNGINQALFGNVNKGFFFFDSTVGQELASYPVNLFYKIGLNPDPRTNDQLTYFYNDMYIQGQSLVQSYYSGNYSRNMERMTDAQVIEKHMMALGSFLDLPPAPSAYVITRWGLDPDIRGCYSTYKVDADLLDFVQFTTSVQKKVYFAGEYVLQETSPGSGEIRGAMGTVYNAYMTGELAGNKIINNQL